MTKTDANYRHGAMNFSRHAVMFLATGGYVGRIPFGPGTFGSLVGIPLVLVTSRFSVAGAAAATIVLILIAVAVAEAAERSLKTKDPGCVVIDEIAGMCVTMLAIPFTAWNVMLGFVLFRVFDITKPPPARQLERCLKGGWGIVMDDVAAGIMANIVLRLAIKLIGLD